MHFILPVGKMHSMTKTVATAPECFVYLLNHLDQK